MSLPSFLLPCSSLTTAPGALYTHALFPHPNPFPHAHCLWWPSPTPRTVILFIPGNPGLLGFYIPFLSFLYEKASPSLAILAHSHLGHTPGIGQLGIPTDASAVHLPAQVESILQVVDAIRSEFGADTKLLLIGHSVGSWLVTQALKARPSDIAGAFLLFPTICNIADTPNGRHLSWIFRSPSPRVVSDASVLIRWLPLRGLSLLFPSWPYEQVSVLSSLLRSRHSIHACLTMADDEMRTIRQLDTELLKEHHERLWFYFAEDDDWVGKQRDAILECLRDAPSAVKVVHGHRDIPHAFCINHGEELASQCLQWLQSGDLL
ncbi:hypothetical protein DENSPDRAFT_865247 [Dentipellis sp. KUC8613]|nr:hypothetical protein DENSPDRAFT_865247 [Dentipellis sp. KUC8613]